VDPDIVLVCCGGGALLAGVSSGLKLVNCKALVYGIEPETASTMYQSFEKNSPAIDHSSKSIAGGLAPPLAGKSAYYHCREHVFRGYAENKENCGSGVGWQYFS